MSLIRLFSLISLICIPVLCCFSQKGKVFVRADSLASSRSDFIPGRSINLGDSVYIIISNCKNTGILIFRNEPDIVLQPHPVKSIEVIKKQTTPLLSIHGNILYNFNYRSYIDTPFAQNDLVQHYVQSSFNLLIKGKYPVRMLLSSRSSNSPYFKNTLDVSFQYNRSQLLDNIKTELKENLTMIDNNANAIVHKGQNLSGQQATHPEFQQLVDLQKLIKYQEELKLKQQQFRGLQSWTRNSSRVQDMVEEKEKAIRKKSQPGDFSTKDISALPGDEIDDYASKGNERISRRGNKFIGSLKSKLTEEKQSVTESAIVENTAAKLDSVKKELEKRKVRLGEEEAKLRQEQKKVTDSVAQIRKEINSLSTGAGLYAFMRKHKLGKGGLTGAQRVLLSVNKIGIGRNWIDYSELTVKNISLTGFNVEMNPLPFYVAFAAGKINYRFRDFIYKNDRDNSITQSVSLLRIGVGQKEKNNFIMTFYDGKKSVLNPSSTIVYNSVQHVLGISAETRLAIDANNFIIAEFAKSSYYNNAAQQLTSSDLKSKAFNFKVRTNEAYSIKLSSRYPATDTRFTAYYKKLGEHFQSFTLYPSGVNQEAWMVRISQQFWKRRITADAAIRKNDFVSPIAAPAFNNKVVFKSFQVTVRIPKYPFVSVGYYPSSQLLLSNNNVLMESQYNTLNAIVSHGYVIRKRLSMNTSAVYTKFYNSGSDTGFIYFNAASYSVNHSIFLSGLQLQTAVTVTKHQKLDLVTLEQQVGYRFKAWLNVTGGLKWIRENHLKTLLGATAAVNLYVKKLGTVQLHYDKTYLPGYNRDLRQVDIGSLSFYKVF